MFTRSIGILFAVVFLPGLAPLLADVRHYDLAVEVLDGALRETATVELVPPVAKGELKLQLASAMKVLSLTCTGKDVPFTHEGWELTVDLSGLTKAADAGGCELVFEVEGWPHNRFSEKRGGFLRTTVGPEIAYIRSQYAWYPRVEGDAASYRTVVEAREDWLVRTAGRQSGAEKSDGRVRWTFVQEQPVFRVGLVAGPYLQKELGGDSPIDAFVFAEDEDGAAHVMEIAQRAWQHYAARFGGVDRERFTLVEMPAPFGRHSGYGEEGYVLVGQGTIEQAKTGSGGEELVAHEVAHSWWGGEVGFVNFASEALASWATLGHLEATSGPGAATAERSRAVKRVVSAAASGKEVALADIAGFGAGMDPETYRVHAYEKGMLLLSMLEDAVGRAKLDGALKAFLEEHRGAQVGWKELRAALARLGSKARPVLEQWESPGLPTLTIEQEGKKSGSRWRVNGTLHQGGTVRPFKMDVLVVALCGEERFETLVKLRGKKASFKLTTPSEPEALLIDPEYHLLVARENLSEVDPEAIMTTAIKEVANDPGQADPQRLEKAIRELQSLLRAGAGDLEGVCHTGTGRCLFRLGRHEEAQQEFEAALRLGAGGPFHRSWIHLRLGCMADVAGDRERALEHYRKAMSQGSNASSEAARRAQRFAEKPYRGYEKDG